MARGEQRGARRPMGEGLREGERVIADSARITACCSRVSATSSSATPTCAPALSMSRTSGTPSSAHGTYTENHTPAAPRRGLERDCQAPAAGARPLEAADRTAGCGRYRSGARRRVRGGPRSACHRNAFRARVRRRRLRGRARPDQARRNERASRAEGREAPRGAEDEARRRPSEPVAAPTTKPLADLVKLEFVLPDAFENDARVPNHTFAKIADYGEGSSLCLWARAGTPATWPIVLIGGEGELEVVAPDLATFAAALRRGWSYHHFEHGRGNERPFYEVEDEITYRTLLARIRRARNAHGAELHAIFGY